MKLQWRAPVSLLLLSAVPTLGGVLRLSALGGGASPDAARFVTSPWPIAVHVVAATLYAVLGAFQFPASFRARWPRWHRLGGRALVVVGLATAVTGVWMAAFYEVPAPMQGPLLRVVRLVVGAGMLGSLVLGLRSILRREVKSHEGWMIRAYALGQGAGTQAVLLGPWGYALGDVSGATRDLGMTVAWVLNLVIAELIIRRRRAPERAVAAAAVTTLS